ncbi:MAG: N-6 DNA methylase [Ekhidna sp.]|nr:N-6 DNA methylase [Ekhidna sp.]
MNERITENIVRTHIHNDFFFKNKKIIVEEQSSNNTRIDKLLKHASKSGNGKGYPEFIIQYNKDANIIIVIECKADISKHESQNKKQYKDYAVDGVLLYASFLSKEYDVIAIAVSGTKNNLKITHFLQLKGTQEAHNIFKDDSFLKLEDYLNAYRTDERKFNQDFKELLSYSKSLNEKLHSLKVKESERSLLISGTLIALEDKAFLNSYKYENPQSLTNLLVNKIEEKLSSVKTPHVKDIITSYNFIKTHTILAKEENKLKEIIDEIDDKINSFIRTYKYFDVLGQFYIEFLRYANNDKSLGIVLTPPHITELFCEIANINKDSVILDTCTGTGGFLISAMKKMIIDVGGNEKRIKQIKEKQIIGIENQHDIYALLCSNMYIHGDGRSNLMKGSCFDDKIKNQVSMFKPNVGFLNPPYKTNKNDREELEFVLNNLNQLEKGSYCIAIVPMSCMMFNKGLGLQLKEKILKKHTLEAVFSMNEELFHSSDVSVVTAIIVLKSKEAHPKNYKTYFGYWKDDGFIKIKNTGRTDYYSKWNLIKNKWLSSYRNKEELEGGSVKKLVKATDEWCSEAYINTDYRNLSNDKFILNIKKYLTYLFNRYRDFSIDILPCLSKVIALNVNRWSKFDYTEIFNITKGKRLTKKDQIDGEYPYISSSAMNNGVDNYIDAYTDENCITFACYGSIGEVFYQKSKVWVSDNANVFYLKNKILNPFLAMFLVTLLKLEQFRFSYGMTGKKERLETFKIKLPVDMQGNPDWYFMENYIKSLPYSSNL